MISVIRSSGTRLFVLLAAVTLPFAAGCGGDMDDLNSYIEEVKARPGKRPDPLPEIEPYETFVYSADVDGLRSPFVPDLPAAGSASSDGNGLRPDTNRSREYLEQFPLDSLDMVGTLQLGGTTFGLLQTQDGLINRVTTGNYVGQNDGKIYEINESEILLKEIVSDGMGGYVEREAAISISD